MSEHMLVRLKPYDPTKGNLKKTHVVHPWKNKLFLAGDWHNLPKDRAEWLIARTFQHSGRDAPRAFEGYSEGDARAVQYREKMERLGRTIDSSKPSEPPVPPPPPEMSTLAHDFNRGEPEHELELTDPEALLESPKPKKRGRPKKRDGRRKKKG